MTDCVEKLWAQKISVIKKYILFVKYFYCIKGPGLVYLIYTVDLSTRRNIEQTPFKIVEEILVCV